MVVNKKYGVVYTPYRLADFIAVLIKNEAAKESYQIQTVIDPACGEGALLEAMKLIENDNIKYYGIDVDNEAISNLSQRIDKRTELFYEDAIIPSNECQSSDFWKRKIPTISTVIANPPWSSEKIYNKQQLASAGFKFNSGQYDSYVLFIELAYEILEYGGYFGFIIPDSIFESQNKNLRRFLAEKTQIKVIARLGEKIFEEVNRATTVIICRKIKPTKDDLTMCFRLNTEHRKQFLSSNIPLYDFYEREKHSVKQARFLMNANCNFDIDTRIDEEELLKKIKINCINLDDYFVFGRGVEISKKGDIAICPFCGNGQGYTKKQLNAGKKKCVNCSEEFVLSDATLKCIIKNTSSKGYKRIIVGEHVKRYFVMGESYIALDIPGINYKNDSLYTSPKLLIRKTGLGIYAGVDYSSGLTNQTVYILKYKQAKSVAPLEYFLALLNSRVIYYYYLKLYGENEWKSHPYLTKDIIFTLPLKIYTGDEIDKGIINLAKEISIEYSYQKDLMLEGLIMKRYNITALERQMIIEEMKRLPDLGAINGMKFEGDINV
ncbi:hypothetical protein PTI45_02041 [Paenibacillus nuruki]|uniref:site-specific DNA-methyltransferase (adenine-specific) n=1 Tax=Paenibacillus nuruki TaxID=1886670 RepID=A0A1E3L422_9BACL|nr:N-6 DNA methylase [Paenibacillus nuruki]ODP28496.1 hypothetical protein PTI45_02041 [Paenibacillus nuruki]